MPRVVERFDVRDEESNEVDTDSDEIARHYYVSQATDEADAKAAVLASPEVPTTYEGLQRHHLSVRDRLSQSVYFIDVIYRNEDDETKKLQLGEYRFSFDTTGRTFRRTTSLRTIDSRLMVFDLPGVAIDFRQAINVSTDGSVEGVDVVTPSMKLQVTKRQPATLIHDVNYIKLLRDMTGRINDAEYLGFGEKELLFLGASGSQSVAATIEAGEVSTTMSAEITYNFESQPTETDIPIGTVAGVQKFVPIKKGWEYLWVYFDKEEILDGAGDPLVTGMMPVQWNLEDVYESEDFGLLDIE